MISYFKITALLSVLISFSICAKIKNFHGAKAALKNIYPKKGETFYCKCKYNNKTIRPKKCGLFYKGYKKRKYRLEWEHVVPAHAFGKSFSEWRESEKLCKSKRKKKVSSRKCARKKSSLFREMEGNIYNLVPAVGSVNALRSNFSFSEISNTKKLVCREGLVINKRKAYPPKSVRGDIARIYFYMNQKYPGRGIISKKNRPLFAKWDKQDPVDKEECNLNLKKAMIQKDENSFVMKSCKGKK